MVVLHRADRRHDLRYTGCYLLFTLLATPAYAIEEAASPMFSTEAELAMVSDYRFKGESQTNQKPAIQAGLTVTHRSNVYVTLWGSSIVVEDAAGLEMDAMLGYTSEIGAVKTDIGIMRYLYPGVATAGKPLEFNQVYASAAYAAVLKPDDELKLELAYSADYYAQTGKYSNISLAYQIPVTDKLGLVSNLSYNTLHDGGNWIDYKVGTAFEVNDIKTELAYIEGQGRYCETVKPNCQGHMVLSLGRVF